MKKINKQILTIFALVLCLSVSVGASLAYFSDYEEASGGASLRLGGKTELREGEDESEKDIVVENTGETNMIVRVAIIGDGVEYFAKDPEFNSSDWAADTDENGVLWYYYKKVLEPGSQTSDIKAKMEFSWDGDEPDYNFDITVVHESAQEVYNGKALVVPAGWDAEGVNSIATENASGEEAE